MYENLLNLPYFQGLSKEDITKILDKVALDFINYNSGDTIYTHDDSCNKFSILIKGRIACIKSHDNEYSLYEILQAPFAIEPYSLFGGNTKYKKDYIAEEECSVITFDKKYLFSELSKYDIFTINLLNIISNKAQRATALLWKSPFISIEGRIAQFVQQRCESGKGMKKLSIKMEQLATALCETRLNISKALNALSDKGVVELHRKEIVIPSLEKLIEAIEE